VDLVDEEHVVLLEVGQQRGQVLGLLEHRPAGLAQVHAQLGGDDVAQRGLAQARRAEQQHVVQRLGAPRAAPMKISSCSRALAWPTYSPALRAAARARSPPRSARMGVLAHHQVRQQRDRSPSAGRL
jgi:hypothetical protein